MLHQLIQYRMLFDFHQKQNAKKPKSVHATYLITGTKRVAKQANGANTQQDNDTVMQGSSFMSSMPDSEEAVEEPIKKTTILLVREEELESTHALGHCGLQ